MKSGFTVIPLAMVVIASQRQRSQYGSRDFYEELKSSRAGIRRHVCPRAWTSGSSYFPEQMVYTFSQVAHTANLQTRISMR
jgi:hypothetical protein